jgi:Apea-like HEPN
LTKIKFHKYVPISGVHFGIDEPFLFELDEHVQILFRSVEPINPIPLIPKFSDDITTRENLMRLGRSTAEIEWISDSEEKLVEYSSALSFWLIAILEIITGNIFDHPVYSDTSLSDIKSSQKKVTLESFEKNEVLFSKSLVNVELKDLIYVTEKLYKVQEFGSTDRFISAIKSYRSMFRLPYPSASIVVGWSGLEALFGVSSELTFRISLLISKYLETEATAQSALFDALKKSYSVRSKIAHGVINDISAETGEAAKVWAWLQRCLLRTIEDNSVPSERKILFGVAT